MGLIVAVLGCDRQADRGVTHDSAPSPGDTTSEPASKPDLIRVAQPLPNQLVTSPLTIEGEARGPWYFEASFPVYLLDAAGDTIAVIPAQAEGEWMTREFVPFKVSLEFPPPKTDRGTLLLVKSNASGLPEHDDELRIPVRFR
jgi:Immunoglobulin-like domain of bacterial spore germination